MTVLRDSPGLHYIRNLMTPSPHIVSLSVLGTDASHSFLEVCTVEYRRYRPHADRHAIKWFGKRAVVCPVDLGALVADVPVPPPTPHSTCSPRAHDGGDGGGPVLHVADVHEVHLGPRGLGGRAHPLQKPANRTGGRGAIPHIPLALAVGTGGLKGGPRGNQLSPVVIRWCPRAVLSV